MSFFSRLFGSGDPPETDRPAAYTRGSYVQLGGDGNYEVKVVGESNYQDALEVICGPRKVDGEDRQCMAELVMENTNPWDPNAVRVDILGRTVGYLSRENAVTYRRLMAERGAEGLVGRCPARIRGGWARGRGKDDRGAYGVILDL